MHMSRRRLKSEATDETVAVPNLAIGVSKSQFQLPLGSKGQAGGLNVPATFNPPRIDAPAVRYQLQFDFLFEG
jgi:hypothetical protein